MRRARGLFALAILVAFVGCGGGNSGTLGQSTTVPPDDAAPTGALFELSTSGGLCATGVCTSTLQVARDGQWTYTEGDDERAGRLSESEASEFAAMVDDEIATLEDIPRKPARSCPSASDGTDVDYVFVSGDATVRLSSCDYDLSAPNALLRAADALAARLQ